MINKLKDLKYKNKILYFVVLPLLGLLIVFKFLIDNNLFKANKELKNTQKQDFDLEKEQKDAEAKANKLIKEANGHKNEAEKLEEKDTEADENWHSK